jgi:hypothetical protein
MRATGASGFRSAHLRWTVNPWSSRGWDIATRVPGLLLPAATPSRFGRPADRQHRSRRGARGARGGSASVRWLRGRPTPVRRGTPAARCNRHPRRGMGGRVRASTRNRDPKYPDGGDVRWLLCTTPFVATLAHAQSATDGAVPPGQRSWNVGPSLRAAVPLRTAQGCRHRRTPSSRIRRERRLPRSTTRCRRLAPAVP